MLTLQDKKENNEIKTIKIIATLRRMRLFLYRKVYFRKENPTTKNRDF